MNRATRLTLLALIFLLATISMILTSLPPVPASPSPVIQQPPTSTYFDHVVVIMMENQGMFQTCGGSSPPCNGPYNSPYMDGLANAYGLSLQYTSLLTVSEPNYIGVLGGSIFSCTKNGGCPAPGTINAPNLVDRLTSAGLTWKAYMENQTPTAGCDTQTHEPYQHEHNGFVEFSDIANNQTRCSQIVLANPALNSTCTVVDCALVNDLNSGTAANFMWLTPNDCNNMHGWSGCTNGCSATSPPNPCVSDGDGYLQSLVPNILNSTTFKTQRAALFITFDEGTGFCPYNNNNKEDCVYAVWAGPQARTTFTSARQYNHYSLTKTIETNWNLTSLTSNDQNASPMSEFLISPAPPPTPPAGAYFDHIVTVLMENKGISDICGFNAPPCNGAPNATYLAGLANNYTLALQYQSLYPASLPNYVGLLGGSTNGCTSSGCPTITSPNLVDRLEAVGLTWKAYMENQPSATGCATSDSLPYVQRHNPFVQYQDITNSSLRCNKIVLANPSSCGSLTDCALINDLNSGSAPNFMWLTPNVCNDMHGNSTCTNGCPFEGASPCITDGNNYLQSLVPTILNSQTFKTQNSVLFIVFDEGIGYCPFNNSNEDCMYAVWAGPAAKNTYVSGHPYNHYSYTKTIEVNWNLTSITSNDANATPMTEFLDPVAPAAPPGKYFDHVVVIMMENEGILEICGGNPPPCGASNAPYEGTLANTYGIGQQYVKLVNTSEPNYFGILGASLFGCNTVTNSSACFPPVGSINAVNLVDRFYGAGVTWKGYMEDQTLLAGCDLTTHGFYEHEHNPFTPFADIYQNTTRCSNIFRANPSTCGSVTDCRLVQDLNSSSIPNFMWLTPNDCNNMHASSGCTNGCTTGGSSTCIVDGDTYLSKLVPEILNSKAFLTTRSALFVTFDEGVGDNCPLNGLSEDCLYSVWAGPVAKAAFHSGTFYNHYSLTKTIEVNWGLATLTSNDAAASPMAEFFKPDYSLSSNPTSLNIQRGDTATSTITLTSYVNFTGTVSLTAAGQPAGPTLTLSPVAVTLGSSGTATSSLSVTGPPTAGNYTVTVTGTSGTLSHNTTIMVFVKDFSLTANPSNLKINVSAVGTSVITLNPINHFIRTVTLTSTGTSGLSTSTSPGSIVGGSGTSTLSVSAPTAGNYTATITGTSGNLTHTVQVSVQVVDFTITAVTIPANIGTSTTSTITISSINHFTGTVTLSDTVPSGVSCGTITPLSITESGTATVSCTSSTVGNYTLSITGVSGSLAHSTTTALRFQDFSLTANPASVSVNAGTQASSNITLTPINGFNGVVSLTTNSTSCSVAPTSLTGSGVALLSCTFQTVGTFHVAVTGTSGSLSHTVVVSYNVEGFSITANPTSLTILAGASGTSTVTVTALGGFTGTVSLSTTISPSSGLTCTLSPTSIILGTSGTSTLSCSGQAGTYTVTITGTGAGISNTASVTYTVQDFILNATSPAAVTAGTTAASTIALLPANGFSATVSLTSTVPSGLNCNAITPSSLSSSGTATISCSSTLAGTYSVTITGSSGSLTHTAIAIFQVTDFSITASTPATVTVNTNTTATITVTFLNGFTGTVSLTDTLPSGLSCGSISPPSLSTTGTATVSCSSSVAGSYNLTITGTSGSLAHSATATFTVTDFTVAATTPAIVTIGTTSTSTITVTAINGFTGTVTLTDVVPSGLFCGAITPGSLASSGTASVSCNATVAGNYVLTITGTIGSLSHSVTATFQVTDFTIAASSPSPVTVGTNANVTITITAINGFTGTVSLTETPASGQSCGTIAPSSLTNSGTATVSCSATVAANYVLTLTGTSGSISHSTTTTFQVTDFTVAASSPAPVLAGIPAASTITLSAINGFTGTISLTDTIPSGLICGTITPNSVTSSGTATVACDANTAGNYTLTITGTTGSLSHSATATFVVQDFTIAASPSSVTVNAGVAGTSTITVTGLNRFAGAVSLTTNSTSCSLSPTSVTGSGSSTLSCTFSIASTVQVGVTGTSGSVSHSATVTFVVQDFAIAAAPTTVNVNVGFAGSSTVMVTALNGFSGLVSLTTNSTSCTISPTSVTGSGSSTLSCTFTTPVTVHITVSGTSASLSHSSIVTIKVQDFTISASAPAPANAGNSTGLTITVSALNQFAGMVNLTDTVPNGLSCGAITPATLTGSGTAAVSCMSSVAGNYTVTITGTSTNLVHAINTTFTIRDYTITASSPAETNVRTSISTTITVNYLNGFSGTVGLTDTLPSGLTCGAITPSSLTSPGTATVSCSSMTAGNYTLTLTGNSTTLSHSTTAVFAFGDFNINATSSGVVDVGQLSTVTITLASMNHFTGTVLLTDSPAIGLSCAQITPATLTGSGTATLSCTASSPGSYSIQFRGTTGALSHTTSIVLQVADFSVSASPSQLSSSVGTNATSTITVTSVNGYSGTVNVTAAIQTQITSGGSFGGGGRRGLEMAPPTSVPNPILNPTSQVLAAGGSMPYTLTIMLPPGTQPGNYTIKVTTTDGIVLHTVQLTIAVSDFSFSTPTAMVTISPGNNSTISLNLQSLNGFQASLNISTTLNPSGPTASANPSTLFLSSNNVVLITINVPSNTPTGNYTLTVQAGTGTLSHTILITIHVQSGMTSALAIILNSNGIASSSIAGLVGLLSLLTIHSIRGHDDLARGRKRQSSSRRSPLWGQARTVASSRQTVIAPFGTLSRISD